MSLAWTKPKDDGGGTIKGYVVEMKPEGGDWTEATPVPVKDTKAKIPKLKVSAAIFVAAASATRMNSSTWPMTRIEDKSSCFPAQKNFENDFLQEGQKYEFRVKAVNEIGPGQPSRATQPVVVETQPGESEL